MAAPASLGSLKKDKRLAQFILKGALTGKPLGSGCYGTTEEVEINGLLCVGKRFHKHLIISEKASVEDIAKKYVEECQLLARLCHPNLTAFLGICFFPKYKLPLLVSEKLDGSLDDLLETIPCLPQSLKRSILEDVASGLAYLHTHNPQIVHGNLTAKNVLLTTSLQAKISDFRNFHIVNVQPNFSSSTATRVYLSPEATDDASCSNPSRDVFSFGHLSLFVLTQVFPDELLDIDYVESLAPEKQLQHSEVERRSKYFKLLNEILVKGENHPLAKLAKDCLNNDSSLRPTAEQVLTVLEDLVDDINGPYGEFSKLDAVRQVASMKVLLVKDVEGKEQDMELTAKSEKVRRLQKKLDHVLKTNDSLIREKDARLLKLQQDIVLLEKSIREKDVLLLQQKEEWQKIVDCLSRTTEQFIERDQQKDKHLQEKEKELTEKDEEIQRRGVRIILKKAEIHLREEELKRFKGRQKQSIFKLKRKDGHIVSLEGRIEKLQVKLEEKVAEVCKKESVINHRSKDFSKLSAQLHQKEEEIKNLMKDKEMKVEELQLKDALLQTKEAELRKLEEHIDQFQAKEKEMTEELHHKEKKQQQSSDEIHELIKKLKEATTETKRKENQLEECHKKLEQNHTELRLKTEELQKMSDELEAKERELRENSLTLDNKNRELHQLAANHQHQIQTKDDELEHNNKEHSETMTKYKERLGLMKKHLQERNSQLKQMKEELKMKELHIQEKVSKIKDKDDQLDLKQKEIHKLQTTLKEKEAELRKKDSAVNHREENVSEIQAKLREKNDLLHEMEKEFQMKMEVLLFKDTLLQRKEVELTSIEEYVCQLKKCMEQMKKELKKSDAKAQQCHKENTELLGEVHRKNLELQKKEDELKERNTKLEQVLAELDQKDHELKQKCKEAELDRKDKIVLEGALLERKEEVLELHKQTATLRLKDEHAHEVEHKLQLEIEELRQTLANYKAQHCQASGDIHKRDTTVLDRSSDEFHSTEEHLDTCLCDRKKEQKTSEGLKENTAVERDTPKMVTETHKKQADKNSDHLDNIMEHILNLQKAQEGLRTDLEQRNTDVGRLQDELLKVKVTSPHRSNKDKH